MEWLGILIILAVLAGAALLLFRLLVPARGKALVCTACGHYGPSKSHTGGSTGIELVLWLCFVIPGLIYSLWRLSTRRQVCAECGGAALVPETSPVGRRMMASTRFQAEPIRAARARASSS